MNWTLPIFNSKVARRILLSFVLAALIPILLLGGLSYRQVETQLRGQTGKALQRSCKDYAYGLIGRLIFLDKSLRMAAMRLEQAGDNGGGAAIGEEHRQWLQGQFAEAVLLGPNGATLSPAADAGEVPELGEQELKSVGAGKTFIRAAANRSGSYSLWMAVNLVENRPEAGILMVELKPEQLWEAENIDPNNLLWIMDAASRQLLFASEPEYGLPADARDRLAQLNSDQFDWQIGNETYLTASWKLPVGNLFAGSDLVIVQSQPAAVAFAGMRQFREIYPPVTALALLVVIYLSMRMIGKYLTPLASLKAATQDIAAGNFDTRVLIDSRDEFETLADSFNAMTQRLRGQFDLLEAMAEIDRTILSALNAGDIIEIVLNRLPGILGCEMIAIADIDPVHLALGNIRVRSGGQAVELPQEPLFLEQQDFTGLLEAGIQLLALEPNRPAPSAYLQRLRGEGAWQYLIVPVAINGALAALLCLGYKAPNTISAEARQAAADFADRIAVALSNAAWEEKLYRQAHYDPLTDLPNRLVLHDRLQQELDRARRDDSQVAVFFLDLDRFKNINDSLGHTAGDELLAQAARIFLQCVRKTDLVVRMGGDEFVIVLSDLHQHGNPAGFVTTIAEKILAAIQRTLVVAGLPVKIGTSLGIAMFPGDADNVEDLLKNADAAMYHAKSEGRGVFRFYSPELNAAALENIKLEHELREAVSRQELLVYYQPKVDWNGRIVGAEALIRWQHAELGMVSPAKFIPLAEQTGLIVEISDWVLEQACLWVKFCHQQGFEPLRVSVNLSAIDFKRSDLVEKVAAVLHSTGIDPCWLELELTESVVIGDVASCVARMQQLKDLGLTLSMDDFGTGFSSLSYLKQLPLDVLKIDQSFVRQLDTDDSSEAIVRAILALADGLGMETIAEGVENQQQVDFLKQQHCALFQGYLYSRPLPANEFLRSLQSGVGRTEPERTLTG
ncbi:EAL domain-containing protein [Methylomonas sp. EFPC3]|uniref:EAL domain-containing protein n=1 Tax=Methylomonas sp. EFPC3 TaxID=3021710 RepID=UPI002417083E|nr:EAL domain-containing protein [Methylomonas sp. EFPC3]WFP49601.1 EAL domain-containing protein [Methylomonas sp. EFPC3]